MRILGYILVVLFVTTSAYGQQINPVPDYIFRNQMSVGRNAVTDTAAYMSIGPRYGAVKGLMPPMVIDTASMSGNKRNGLTIFSIQKNKYLYWDSIGAKWAEMAGTAGNAITGTGAGNYLSEFTSATNIDSTSLYHTNGRFGIGTTSPQTRLHVNDELMSSKILVDTANGMAYSSPWRATGVKNNFNGVSHWWGRSAGAGANPAGGGDFTFFKSRRGDSALLPDEEIWYYEWRAKHRDNDANWSTNDSTILFQQVARYKLHSNNMPSAYMDFIAKSNVNTKIQLLRLDPVSSTTVFADSTFGSRGNTYLSTNGNTGVGYAAGASIPRMFSVNGNIKIGNYIYGSANTILLGQDGTGGLNMYFGDVNNNITGSRASIHARDYISLINNGTENIRITSAGNMGVGTISPDAKIHSNTNLLVSGTTTTASGITPLANGITVIGGSALAGASANLRLANASTSNTTNDVLGTIDFFSNDGSGSGQGVHSRIQSIVEAANGTTAALALSTGSTAALTERMRIFANGRIGVNTTTDAGYQFDVAGSMRNTTDAYFNTTSGETYIGTTSDAGAFRLQVNGVTYSADGLRTGAPTGGTSATWKLGTVASVSPTSPNRTIEVDIGGTIYYIHAKTTND